MFGRAMLRRCPNCGGRRIFGRWLVLADDCPSCGIHFERQEGYWVGAVAINTVATVILFSVVFVGTMVLFWPDVPWGGILAVVVVMNLLFPIVFYPVSKTLWIAIDLAVHPEVRGDSAR